MRKSAVIRSFTAAPRRALFAAALSVAALAVAVTASPAAAAPPAFSDQTIDAGVFHVHLTSGFTSANYTGGSTVGDFNNNGYIDLFVIGGGNNNRPDRLFINNTDGTFTDQAKAWGVDAVHRGKSAVAGDFNNDGWLDLYVTSAGPVAGAAPGHHKLYRNDSNASQGEYLFTNIAAAAGVNFSNPALEDAWTACFGDYDLDGDLDLFVGGFRFGILNNNGNRLFQNNFSGGNETFTDVTAAIGLFQGIGPIACLACALADMNGDAWPELLMVGDFKGVNYIGSRYFRNNGPNAEGVVTFSDRTVATNTGHEENGMGHTLGDFQNDGRLDWYVTSIHLPSNGWTGNKLYRNNGNHHFTEHAAAAGVAPGHYGWGATAVDFNNNGWVDLAATNGDGAASGIFYNKASQLWMNNGNPPSNTFTEVAVESGFSHFGKGRTLITLDYNNDGRQDLLLTSYNEALFLFRNDLDLSGGDANWLRVHLDTSGGSSDGQPLAPNGLGAMVSVTVGSVTRYRWVNGSVSFLGADELAAHFGLGDLFANPPHTGIIDEVRVTWTNGEDTVLTNVAANQILTLTPPSPHVTCPGDLTGNGAVGVPDLLQLLSCWGAITPGSDCEAADLTNSGTVGVPDLLQLLANWGACPQ